MQDELNVSEVAARLTEVVSKAESGRSTVIVRSGERVAAVVPTEVRTDPMGDEVDGMPTFEGGGGSILADLDRHMEGFGR